MIIYNPSFEKMNAKGGKIAIRFNYEGFFLIILSYEYKVE